MKGKPYTLAILHRNSTKIGKSQKKTKSPKENQSSIYLPSSIGSTII